MVPLGSQGKRRSEEKSVTTESKGSTVDVYVWQIIAAPQMHRGTNLIWQAAENRSLDGSFERARLRAAP